MYAAKTQSFSFNRPLGVRSTVRSHCGARGHLVRRGRRFWCGWSLRLKPRWSNGPSPCRTGRRSASRPSLLCRRFSSSQRRRSYSPCEVNEQTESTRQQVNAGRGLVKHAEEEEEEEGRVIHPDQWKRQEEAVKSLLVFPDGLHLLGVVAHVALQPDALWGTLQHQLRGRRPCEHATPTQLHKAEPSGLMQGSAAPTHRRSERWR